MHNYKLLLILFLLFDIVIVSAQNTLTGIVLENDETLEGATVILKLLPDSIISATITNSKGEFTIEGIKSGIYNISASFLGLKAIEQNIEITGDKVVRLILKEKDVITLNDVVVETDRSRIVQSTPEGSIFFLSSKAKNSKDIFSALQEIPKLSINITNHSISLNDGSSPLILVNGVNREGASLGAIDPQIIESIEIIENAKAKYLNNGISSVINVKLKKTPDQYKYVNIGTKENPKLIYGYSDLNTTFMNSKYSLYLTGQHFYFYNNKSILQNAQNTSSMTKLLIADRESNYGSYFGCLGGDWSISNKNYLSYSFTYINVPESYIENGDGEIENPITNEIFNTNYYKTYKKSFILNTNNFYYKHTFSPKSDFESVMRFNYNGGTNKGLQSESSLQNGDYNFVNNFDFKNERIAGSLNLDYSTNISNAHYVDFGSRTEFQNNKIDQKSLKEPAFRYKEFIEYLYIGYSKNWNDKFSSAFSGGMSIINSKAEVISNNYANIKYSLNLNYSINNQNRIRLSANRYTVAPSVNLLNPYDTSTDSLLITQGNPLLKPYNADNVNLSYSINKGPIFIEPQLFYKNINNLISIRGYLDNGVYIQSPTNTGKFQQVGCGLSTRYSIKNIGFINLFTQYNRLLFRRGIKNQAIVKANLNFNFYYKKVSLSGYYILPTYEYEETQKSKSSSESEISFLWNINKHWDITFGSRYIAGRFMYEIWTNNQDYRYYYSNISQSRNIVMLFGFRYNFRNIVKPKREQKLIYQEDQGVELIKIK